MDTRSDLSKFSIKIWRTFFDIYQSKSTHEYGERLNETCLLLEENINLHELKGHINSELQPSTKWRRTCTMLFLSHLADVELVTVDCDQPMLPNIVCVQHNHTKNISSIANTGEGNFCSSDKVLIQNLCYTFFRYQITDFNIIQSKRSCSLENKVAKNNSLTFSSIFQATNVDHMTFLLLQIKKHTDLYTRKFGQKVVLK